MRTDTRFHRRSNTKCLMHAREIVVHVEQRNHRNVVFNLLTECVSESCKSAHVHSHVKILALDVAGGNVSFIRLSDDLDALCSKPLRRTIPLLPFSIPSLTLHP